MDIMKLTCPSCGGLLPGTAGKVACEYCGTQVVIESKQIAERETQEVIVSESEATQSELRKLQLTQERSMLQMQLSNLRSEKRSIDLVSKKTKQHYEQLAQIEAEEKRILYRIHSIQSALSPTPLDPSVSGPQSVAGPWVSFQGEQKSQGVALALAFFLGFFGAHRFYTGHTKLGVIYLFTMGLFGFGMFIDIVLLLFNQYKDARGLPLKPLGSFSKRLAAGFIVWTILMMIVVSINPEPNPSVVFWMMLLAAALVNVDRVLGRKKSPKVI